MELSMLIALFLASAVRMAVPLLLGTLGESLTERAGNLNLGVEGLMMMGAATGFIAAYHTENIALAILAGMLGSGFGALLYAILIYIFKHLDALFLSNAISEFYHLMEFPGCIYM